MKMRARPAPSLLPALALLGGLSACADPSPAADDATSDASDHALGVDYSNGVTPAEDADPCAPTPLPFGSIAIAGPSDSAPLASDPLHLVVPEDVGHSVYVRWYVGGVEKGGGVNLLTSEGLAAAKGEVWYACVEPVAPADCPQVDSSAEQVCSPPLTIGNSAPTCGGAVQLTPSQGSLATPFTCACPAAADQDAADKVSCTIKLLTGGSPVPGTEKVTTAGDPCAATFDLSATTLGPDHKVTCAVELTDGQDKTTAQSSASATIVDTPPTLDSAHIEAPDKATVLSPLTCVTSPVKDLECKGAASCGTVQRVWRVGGCVLGTEATDIAVLDQKEDPCVKGVDLSSATVQCCATPTDLAGTKGAEVCSPAITLVDLPPSPPSVSLVPSKAPPTVADTVACEATGSVDPEGGKITYSCQFVVDGVAVPVGDGGKQPTLSLGAYQKGSFVACACTASDAAGNVSEPMKSKSVVLIANSPPTATCTSISQSLEDGTITLAAKCTASDLDAGDTPTLTASWAVDGQAPAGESPKALTATTKQLAASPGSKVCVTVTPHDGEDKGTMAGSPPCVVLDDHPATLAAVSLVMSGDPCDEVLTCTAGSIEDPDFHLPGTAKIELCLAASGSPVAGTCKTGKGTASWSAKELGLKGPLTCIGRVDGESGYGPAKTSAAVSPAQCTAPPSSVTVSASYEPDESQYVATCSYSASGTASASYEWSLGAAAWEAGKKTRGLGACPTGLDVRCRVRLAAGSAAQPSAWVASASTLVTNELPTFTGAAEIGPSPLVAGTKAICKPAGGTWSDPEGEDPAYETGWLKNGELLPTSAAELPASSFEAGDELLCELTPVDTCGPGAPVTSAPVTVEAPACAIAVEASPTSGTVCTPEFTCSVEAAAACKAGKSVFWLGPGNTVIGKGGALTSADVLAAGLEAGDTFTCAFGVTASTATKAKKAVTLTSKPVMKPSITLVPAAPKAGQVPTVVVAPPSDACIGEPITYDFAWTLDGAPAGQGSATGPKLPGCSTVSVTVTATAGGSSAKNTTSASVKGTSAVCFGGGTGSLTADVPLPLDRGWLSLCYDPAGTTASAEGNWLFYTDGVDGTEVVGIRIAGDDNAVSVSFGTDPLETGLAFGNAPYCLALGWEPHANPLVAKTVVTLHWDDGSNSKPLVAPLLTANDPTRFTVGNHADLLGAVGGCIDEIALYAAPPELPVVSQSPATLDCATIAAWRLIEGGGDTAFDLSGNLHDAHLDGIVWSESAGIVDQCESQFWDPPLCDE